MLRINHLWINFHEVNTFLQFKLFFCNRCAFLYLGGFFFNNRAGYIYL